MKIYLKIRTLDAGYEDEKERVKSTLNINEVYAVRTQDIQVGSSYSSVRIGSERWYNTVFFTFYIDKDCTNAIDIIKLYRENSSMFNPGSVHAIY